MKLVTFATEAASTPRPGALLRDGAVLDFTHPDLDLPAALAPLEWCDLDGACLPRASEVVRRAEAEPARREQLRKSGALLERSAVRLGAPVARPGKVICIGLNYRDHAIESGMAIPEAPVVFSKFPTCVVGPEDEVRLPADSTQGDYEAELGVVIGRLARNVAEVDAHEHVLGYVNANDVSARDFQFADGQWQRGKSCDTFCPIGEFIATTDEIADPHRLRIQLRLDGKTLQDSNTDQLIFGVPALIAYLSRSITLEPGDLILTGTPPGVGFARKPPIYLKDGDVMEVEIEGLGVLRNPVVQG